MATWPNSAGSQFFFVAGPAGESLPPSYTLFGKVTAGQDVVDKIKGVATGNKNGMGDVPNETVKILEVRRAQ